ncbi:hypothetical protein O181_035637 [Austropuccinia psidii MF-1]|uniref:Uncharacterized protein n=1 Tax=Austropuccinia psidii MF-1 TaxID=1389203 RepID=A0A9Q3D5K7_9BASI|nr:hypothetical protein [Austropuccinia psidii MF-1]
MDKLPIGLMGPPLEIQTKSVRLVTNPSKGHRSFPMDPGPHSFQNGFFFSKVPFLENVSTKGQKFEEDRFQKQQLNPINTNLYLQTGCKINHAEFPKGDTVHLFSKIKVRDDPRRSFQLFKNHYIIWTTQASHTAFIQSNLYAIDPSGQSNLIL